MFIYVCEAAAAVALAVGMVLAHGWLEQRFEPQEPLTDEEQDRVAR